MTSFFIDTFWITVFILWLALIILYFILTNRKSLERKGHHEKYITYLRKSHLFRILLIAVLMPLLILLSGYIIYLITGTLTDEVQLAYIIVVLIILVIPIKIVDERINQKKIKELALETSEKVAVDMNYKALHLIFNPPWELILAPITLLYGIFYLGIEQWIIYLFLLIPWLMYFNIRGTRYQTRPYLNDNYKYMFAFNVFNFLFFLSYFCTYYLIRLKDLNSDSSPVLLIVGLLIILGLLGRVCIYLANYREFNKLLSGVQDQSRTSLSRKMIFLVSGYLILFTLSGASLTFDLIRPGKVEVGVVQEKYLIHTDHIHSDTLLMIQSNLQDSGFFYEEQDFPGELKMECKVRLSTSQRMKTYHICCPTLFEELPIGSIVKFEYGNGSIITELVDY
jgi:hypothetical protein